MDSTSKRHIAENRGDTYDAGADSHLEMDMTMEVDTGGDAEAVEGASTEGAYLAHALRDMHYTP